MQVLYTHCAGLDVHKRTVVACCLTPDPEGGWHHETRTFQTMTVDLLALADWLREREVTHVAMESTGEYWRPVFNILEAEFATLLVNAAHVKNVPGRKTDVRDAQWLAELLQHGLLRPSFIPSVPIRELRDLVRHREPPSCASGRRSRTVCRRCWKPPTSSWRASPPMSWACRAAGCSTPSSPEKRTLQ